MLLDPYQREGFYNLSDGKNRLTSSGTGRRKSMRFMAVFFLVFQTALAQHGGGFHGAASSRGGVQGRGFGSRSAFAHTNRGFEGRIRSRFSSPYSPFYGGYGFLSDYPYWDDSSYSGFYGNEAPFPPSAFLAPPAAQTSPEPAEPVRPAQPVIHEYTWPKSEESGQGAATFTIALKDGSQRFATAAWVQGGKLHYLDSEDRQQVLSSEVIDRQTTARLNNEKHLHLSLPPG